MFIDVSPAFALDKPPGPTADQKELIGVIDRLRLAIIVLLGALASLFLTIGGFRWLSAGEPGEVEKAKSALKAAAVGYVIAALAKVLFDILYAVVFGS
ncbi:hypothetical protein GCM10009765_23540 [Fodinicola feengrottensis]|uniref:Uncharacterized protein n=1 Tax=Fodinicola feengrottensis TaxID=435914 RepID=A0ABN2GLY2_9ACTN